ncbi:ATP-binding protein [Desulfoluna spongiiphila]|uniref:ATP-binding protein n=1 Tax=Desulfoluna spongiiphila TaxID=419481 RepID=UPI0012577F79|nr:ATP-binding protein [Desulfoluna spongiiphila]VVS91595.1 pas fold-3 [Desulfoluna spongiiphila]
MPFRRIKTISRRLKGSLAAKQLFYILIFSFFITFVGTSFNLFLEYKKDLSAVDDQFTQIREGHLESLSGSLWQLDDLQISTHLNDMLTMRDLIYLEIRENGEVLFSAGRLKEGEQWVRRGFDMFFSHGGQQRHIGVLDAYASLEGVHQRLFERLFVILVTQAFKVLLVSMVILAVLHRVATRHISAIAGYATSIRPHELGTRLELPNREVDPEYPDEIDELVSALNQMRQRLFHDMERRQAVEHQLARNRALLDETQKLSNIGGWEYHVDDELFLWTNQLYEIHGLEVDPTVDHFEVSIACYSKADGEAVGRAFTECIDRGRPYDLDCEITTCKGEKKWIRTTGRPVFEGDRVVRVVGNMMDITESVKAEEAQRRSLKTLMTVLDSVDAIICVSDTDTFRILFMNKAMIESFGEGLTGQEYHALFMAGREKAGPPGVSPRAGIPDHAGALVWESRNQAGAFYINYERSIQWVDGRQVRFHHGVDITQIKKMEEELRQSHKMEAIGGLAGGIAHDFNNILSSVLGYTELALDDVPPETRLEGYLQEIYLAGTRAVALVRQILTFARQGDEEMVAIQVKPIVNEALKLIRSSIPSTVEITRDIESESLIFGNATQVHQILMNLCTNAASAMEGEGGVLDVKLFDTALGYGGTPVPVSLLPGNYLSLRVADTGCGIPPEVMPSIFEPFFTTKAPGEGTGMGLAMVHGIVKKWGGEIKVENNTPRGAVFTVYLPITEEENEPSEPLPEDDTLPTGGERVLVVDDEPAIARMIGKILGRLGYTAVIRTDSVEALELFRSGPEHFNLVMTDMTMPTMTGDLLAAEMLRMRPELPVILCTGYSNRVTDAALAEIGIKAFMTKPIVKKELARVVRTLLDEAGKGAGST